MEIKAKLRVRPRFVVPGFIGGMGNASPEEEDAAGYVCGEVGGWAAMKALAAGPALGNVVGIAERRVEA